MTAEPIALHVTRYKCPFCTNSYSKKSAAETHIARCWHNPGARGCKTCVHFQPHETGPYPEHPGFPEDCAIGHDLATGPVTGCTSHQTAREAALLEGAAAIQDVIDRDKAMFPERSDGRTAAAGARQIILGLLDQAVTPVVREQPHG